MRVNKKIDPTVNIEEVKQTAINIVGSKQEEASATKKRAPPPPPSERVGKRC